MPGPGISRSAPGPPATVPLTVPSSSPGPRSTTLPVQPPPVTVSSPPPALNISADWTPAHTAFTESELPVPTTRVVSMLAQLNEVAGLTTELSVQAPPEPSVNFVALLDALTVWPVAHVPAMQNAV